MVNPHRLYRELVRIEVTRQFPEQRRGRPRRLTFEDAYDGMLRVLRTGMQWRQLETSRVSHITASRNPLSAINVHPVRGGQ